MNTFHFDNLYCPKIVFYGLIFLNYRNALIAKSQLYDKLRNKEVTADDPDKFLVDFDGKKNHKEDTYESFSDHNSDPEDDWLVYLCNS